jgi:hypothetical protein
MTNSEFPIHEERCENLRWKGLLVDSDAALASGEGHIFWCMKTQLGLGPDGKVVDNQECNPSRPCYKAL